MTLNQIDCARAAVVAKVAYWDALRAFEIATCNVNDDEWSSRLNNRVHETVEHIAACAGDTAGNPECLTNEDLKLAFGFLSNILTLSHPL